MFFVVVGLIVVHKRYLNSGCLNTLFIIPHGSSLHGMSYPIWGCFLFAKIRDWVSFSVALKAIENKMLEESS